MSTEGTAIIDISGDGGVFKEILLKGDGEKPSPGAKVFGMMREIPKVDKNLTPHKCISKEVLKQKTPIQPSKKENFFWIPLNEVVHSPLSLERVSLIIIMESLITYP